MLSLLGLLLLGVVVFLLGAVERWTARSFGELVVLRMMGLFYLPIVALVFGAGALGEEREDKTLSYLLTRPVPRWGIFVGKYAAALPVTLVLNAGGLWLLQKVALLGGQPDLHGAFELYAPAVLLGTLAYLGLFHFLGAAFRHSTLISIAYVFFVEVFLGRVPGVLKRVSICFYTWSMVYEVGQPLGVQAPPRVVFLPVGGDVARLVLLLIAATFVILGAVYFSRREYTEGS